IVKQSSGHVTVYSELNKGTNFRIYLPRVLESKNMGIAEDQHRHLDLPDGCRVLLVDDNDLVRRALSDLLEMNQCVVVQTSDPEKALKILKEGNPFEILMTDIVLPKFGGVELAAEARAILPEISILFMSGYSENVVQYKPDRKTAFLTKPVSIQKVLMTFAELMNADFASS
ncbi:MAG: ATP-binding response regulator, partial [Acidobacteriota bacterium]